MGRNLERERGSNMYKGSDGLLTTREAFMRIVAKKRGKKRGGGRTAGSSFPFSGVKAPGRFKSGGGV